MPNRGMNQDQQQTGRRNPLQTTPDDDEIETGDATQMEEAGNSLPSRNTQQAATVDDDSGLEDEEVEGDEDEDGDEAEAQDDEPIGNRV